MIGLCKDWLVTRDGNVVLGRKRLAAPEVDPKGVRISYIGRGPKQDCPPTHPIRFEQQQHTRGRQDDSRWAHDISHVLSSSSEQVSVLVVFKCSNLKVDFSEPNDRTDSSRKKRRTLRSPWWFLRPLRSLLEGKSHERESDGDGEIWTTDMKYYPWSCSSGTIVGVGGDWR
eukprot:scaffold2267_cov162-Amphora_coffeaeformis.AAC.2